MVKKRKGRVSEETFDEFLAQQGMLGTCEDRALKEIIAAQLAEAMKTQGITKSAMAARMKQLIEPAGAAALGGDLGRGGLPAAGGWRDGRVSRAGAGRRGSQGAAQLPAATGRDHVRSA